MNDAVVTRSSFTEALQEHLDAIAERDIDRFAATLADSPELRLVGGDGSIIHGKENAVGAHRDWFMNDDWTFSPEIEWMHETAEAAWALTRVSYRERDTEKLFLLLFGFVVDDGEWKLLFDQNTPIEA